MRDDFFTKAKCDRCGSSLNSGRIMSMFNTDCICMKCKEDERNHPDYKKSQEKERQEVISGNYNYQGIWG